MLRLQEAVAPEAKAELAADVVVLGSGMAGLACAARCAQAGRRAVVLEKAGLVGGSARLSAGYVWTAPDIDTMAAEDPGGDDALARALIEGFAGTVEWILALGVGAGEEIPVLGFGRGCQIDMAAYIDACVAAVEQAGGLVLTSARNADLVSSAEGLQGVSVEVPSGPVFVRAPWIVLATGGFQANLDLVRRHVSRDAERLLLRSNTQSTGDGISLGVSAGAAITHQTMGGFYGHLVPSPLAALSIDDYTRLSQYHSERGVLVDTHGRRFTDESQGDHMNAQALAAQPGAVAYLIIDERIRQEFVLTAYAAGQQVGIDKMAEGGRLGARYLAAESLEELAEGMAGWGVPASALLDTVKAYNAAVGYGEGWRLRPTRTKSLLPLEEPPFAVLEVAPAITMTYGGLLTDGHGQVLDCRGDPIAGLMAAGADMGGVFHRGYGGGLARAAVFGLRAAERVLRQP